MFDRLCESCEIIGKENAKSKKNRFILNDLKIKKETW